MPTIDFIIALFCRVDDELEDVPKHSLAKLYPSEVVTLALLFGIKGVGNRPFYRWIDNNWRHLFPKLPCRTRLYRLFNSHQHLTRQFLADPTVMSVIDTYGIELIHPVREDEALTRLARKVNLTIAGSSEASCACWSISMAGSLLGIATPRMCMTATSRIWSSSLKAR